MNDNYLWDRTGGADTEVQRLEELLGTLRYQPKPLQIPSSITIGRKRSYGWLAIAAAVALMVIAAGVWLRVRTLKSTPPTEASRDQRGAPLTPNAPSSEPERVAVNKEPGTPNIVRQPQRIAGTTIHKSRVRRAEPALTTQELAQKEQLLTALRLVSAKLNFAQRKSQGLPQTNIIRNQHRIG
jgi:hypothetical protein